VINPLPVVRAELRRARLATAAAVALIAVAVALGVAVTAQERAVRQGSARAADPFDVVVGARGSATQLVLGTVYLRPEPLELLPGETLQRVQDERGVAWAAPLAFGDSHAGAPIVGTTSAFVERGGAPALAAGRVFTGPGEAVVGADVALAVGAQLTPAHGEVGGSSDGLHGGVEYRVVGVLARQDTPWDRAILVPIESVWRLHARPSGHAPGDTRVGPPWEKGPSGASAIVVKAASIADAYRLRARFRTGETMAVFPAEVLVELHATLGDARDLLAVVALLTQGLVVAAVMLAVLATQVQRRRLFGVLRALGASRTYVVAVSWLHVSLILAAGGLLGALLGWQGAVTVSSVVHARTGLRVVPVLAGPEIRLVAWLVLGGAVAAILPAWQAQRRPVVSLLRS
jgi:putative ABC transport system permease protein